MKRYGIVRQYNQSKLKIMNRYEIGFDNAPYPLDITEAINHVSEMYKRYNVTFALKEGEWINVNVGLEILFEKWTNKNYIVFPGAVYDGNRFESREIKYSPKLTSLEDIGKSIQTIITDVPRLDIHKVHSKIQLLAGDMSEPSIGVFFPNENKGIWIIAKQREGTYTYGLEIEENKNKASIIIAVPGIRDTYKYSMCTTKEKSKDQGITLNHKGVSISFDYFEEPCSSIEIFYDMYKRIRQLVYVKEKYLNTMPYSQALRMLYEKQNRANWVEEYGYYSVGLRSNFLENWSIGWTGGFPTLYALAKAGKYDAIDRISRNFDYVFPDGQTECGLLWDCGEYGKWYGGDIRREHTKNWHLIRKSGDALYFIILLFDCYKQMEIEDKIKYTWIKGTERLASKLVSIYEKNGQLGQFVHNQTGEIIVGGSSSSANVPAALIKAYEYYGDEKYLDCACKLANQLYDDYICRGYTTGGPGDALQNPDSESGFAFVISFIELYECTKDLSWLQKAKAAANLYATWVVPYSFVFPTESLFGRLKIDTRGAVYANTQNKHGSPGICTSSGLALLKLFRATRDYFYLDLLQGTAHHITQYISTKEQPIGDLEVGWINERVNMSDWLEPVGEIFTGSTWAEVSCLLTVGELPGVYVLLDQHVAIAFDNIICQICNENEVQKLLLINETNYDAVVYVYCETDQQCEAKWNNEWIQKSMNVHIPMKESVTITLLDSEIKE